MEDNEIWKIVVVSQRAYWMSSNGQCKTINGPIRGCTIKKDGTNILFYCLGGYTKSASYWMCCAFYFTEVNKMHENGIAWAPIHVDSNPTNIGIGNIRLSKTLATKNRCVIRKKPCVDATLHIVALRSKRRRLIPLTPRIPQVYAQFREQKDFLTQKLPFKRMVKEIGRGYKTDIRFEKEAFTDLQKAFEVYMVALFEDSKRRAARANRVTIQPSDFYSMPRNDIDEHLNE